MGIFYEPFGLRAESLRPLRGGNMGRILLLSGIAILGYGYYTNTSDNILTLIAFVLIAMGAIFYFLTGFK
jgi:hypothetical protein